MVRLYFDMFDLVELQVCHIVLTFELMCATAKRGGATHTLLRKQHILFQRASEDEEKVYTSSQLNLCSILKLLDLNA